MDFSFQLEWIYIYIYIYCGAKEFVISAHFALGLRAHVEDRRCRGHATEVQMA